MDEEFDPQDLDPEEAQPIKDIERFMLYCHEWAFWNVHLGYAGIPPEFKPVYIPMRMEKEPVPIETLTEHLTGEEVSEITLQHVETDDNEMRINMLSFEELVTHLSRRMDYNAKLSLVDKGLAFMSWDAATNEPIFIPTGDGESLAEEP